RRTFPTSVNNYRCYSAGMQVAARNRRSPPGYASLLNLQEPLDKLRQTGAQRCLRIITEQRPCFRNIRARQWHISGLLGQLVDFRLAAKRLFNGRNQILQLDGLALAEIEDIEERSLVFQGGQHTLNDVVNVSVIAPCRSIAELIDRFARLNSLREMMNREIGPLSRA